MVCLIEDTDCAQHFRAGEKRRTLNVRVLKRMRCTRGTGIRRGKEASTVNRKPMALPGCKGGFRPGIGIFDSPLTARIIPLEGADDPVVAPLLHERRKMAH